MRNYDSLSTLFRVNHNETFFHENFEFFNISQRKELFLQIFKGNLKYTVEKLPQLDIEG